MICPVCGRKFPFFSSGGVYCSPECFDRAVEELEDLLDRMEQEDEVVPDQDER